MGSGTYGGKQVISQQMYSQLAQPSPYEELSPYDKIRKRGEAKLHRLRQAAIEAMKASDMQMKALNSDMQPGFIQKLRHEVDAELEGVLC